MSSTENDMARAHHALASAAGIVAGMLARRKVNPPLLLKTLAETKKAIELLTALCQEYPVREPLLPFGPPPTERP